MIYDMIVNKGDLVYDIGANTGRKTDIFLNRGAKVVCIEPHPDCYNSLVQKYQNNPNVNLVNIALTDYEGTAILKLTDATTISTLSEKFIAKTKKERFSEFSWNRSVEVKTNTLDSIISQYGLPSFCKIDVEGGEVAVLKGLTKSIQSIAFEFTPELCDNAEDCIRRLIEINDKYRFNYSYGESMIFKYDDVIDAKTILTYLKSIDDYKVTFGDVYAFIKD